MKLVDVEEVHEIFNWSHQKPPYSKKTIHRYIDMAREVDAVPVIRCKDCKHWQYESCFVESEEGDAESIILDRFAFDFCSRAERRNDETD